MPSFWQLDPEMRVSDADRESVAGSLARHVAAGRLTLEEYTERLDECFGARTAGALRAVLRELPEERPARAAPPDGPVRRPGWTPGVPLLPLLLVLAVASAVVHAPLFLLLIPAVVLARRGPHGRCGHRTEWSRSSTQAGAGRAHR